MGFVLQWSLCSKTGRATLQYALRATSMTRLVTHPDQLPFQPPSFSLFYAPYTSVLNSMGPAVASLRALHAGESFVHEPIEVFLPPTPDLTRLP
ncbi:unnamed protein product [Haemonchus placei]|uniref:Uncharacterized protein n=1 Tax=Haemonchus placei TaxID=6290 RepID=A0A3P7UG30_HAEPC|nr:unnamed protein product [Haemonchus placei]